MELTVPVEGGYLWADDSGGSGPVLALLHPGWGVSSIWLPMLDDLAQRYRVIRYDTRGFGRSPASRAPYTQLGDLTAVLDHCGAADAMLVGHSGGASTAVSLALASPRRVRSLLLLAPGVSDYPWPLDDPCFTGFEALFTAGDRDGITALALRTWAAAGAGQVVQAQVRAAVEAYFSLGDQERPDPPSFGRLGEIVVPTAMVIGDLDYPVEIRCAQDIAARIPGCRQVVAPGADHMLPLRRPGQLCDLIGKLDRSEDLPETI
jgi:3-oxoadipate enol-lactonase